MDIKVERVGSRLPWQRWRAVVERPLGFDRPLIEYALTARGARRKAYRALNFAL